MKFNILTLVRAKSVAAHLSYDLFIAVNLKLHEQAYMSISNLILGTGKRFSEDSRLIKQPCTHNKCDGDWEAVDGATTLYVQNAGGSEQLVLPSWNWTRSVQTLRGRFGNGMRTWRETRRKGEFARQARRVRKIIDYKNRRIY